MKDRVIREKKFHDQEFTENSRSAVAKFYSIVKTSRAYFLNRMSQECENMKVLEYGCGPGTYAFDLTEKGAHVTGIDISDVAIKMAETEARKRGIGEKIAFVVMDAEALQFDNDSFDKVCGVSILHHLDLEVALKEINRVLKKNGVAAFIEPLGHNPLINFYRYLTPKLRSQDEHPLLNSDIELMWSFFKEVEVCYFHLVSLFAVPFRKMQFYNSLLHILEKIDQKLFKFAFFQKLAWQAVIELRCPLKKV